MADNQDRRNQKTVWDILPALAMIGSIITAWVNLNGELTQLQITQEYSEKLTTVRLTDLQKSIDAMHIKITQVTATDKDLEEQIADLERTVTHMYSKRNK